MAGERRARAAAAVVEEIVAVPNAVSLEIVRDSMIVVGAGLRHDVEDAAGCASELGVVAVGLDLEFLHRIDRRIDYAAIDVGGRIRRAVDQDLLRT